MKISTPQLVLSILLAGAISSFASSFLLDSKATSAESHLVFNYLNANAVTPDLLDRFEAVTKSGFRSKNKLANILLDAQTQVAGRAQSHN